MIESYKLMLAATILTLFGAVLDALGGNYNMAVLFGICAVFFTFLTIGMKRKMKNDPPPLNNDEINAFLHDIGEVDEEK